MIVLDTNVLSELLRPVPAVVVTEWLDAQPRAGLFTTSITRAEILYGIRLLPPGQRRSSLEAVAVDIFAVDFSEQVLPFDSAAADEFAALCVARRSAGRPISQLDAQIAAIARSRGARLATRNVRDFEGCGVELIDPWSH